MTKRFTTFTALYFPFCAILKVTVHEPFDFTAIEDFALLSEHAPETVQVFAPADGVLTNVFKVTFEEATSQVFFQVVFATESADT